MTDVRMIDILSLTDKTHVKAPISELIDFAKYAASNPTFVTLVAQRPEFFDNSPEVVERHEMKILAEILKYLELSGKDLRLRSAYKQAYLIAEDHLNGKISLDNTEEVFERLKYHISGDSPYD